MVQDIRVSVHFLIHRVMRFFVCKPFLKLSLGTELQQKGATWFSSLFFILCRTAAKNEDVTVAAELTPCQVSSSDDALTTVVAATEACADVDKQPALALSEEVKNDSVEDVWDLSAFKGTEEIDDVDVECAASAEGSADEVCGARCWLCYTYLPQS
jgi:hypothetical protein